jgi:predicted amidohydrolase
MSGESLVVALAQTASRRSDVKANVEAAAELMAAAACAGAELLVFPELSLVGYDLAQLADPAVWVSADDPRLDPIRRPALTTVVGAPFRGEDGSALLAALVLHPDGRMAVHGKRHLHGPERDWFHAGAPADPLDVGGWLVATAICYDAGIPAHAQDAANRGAEVYAASVLYTQAEVRRFDLHFAARAMDHRMYAVAANHAGTGAGWESCGGSGVWHPDGRRVLRAGSESGLLTWALSRADLEELRDRDAAAGYPRGQSR